MSDEHAIVFSGGASAAYEVGVLKALLTERCRHIENSPIDPEIYSGISLGALNAAVMGSRGGWANDNAVEYLERLWIDRIAGSPIAPGNGLFRYRFLPVHYPTFGVFLSRPLKPLLDFGRDCLFVAGNLVKRSAQIVASDETVATRAFKLADFSTGVDLSPLQELMSEVVDMEKLRRSRKKVSITAANWDNGKPEPFINRDLDGAMDCQLLEGEQGHEALVASGAIPGIVPSQTIDDQLFFDTAVLIDAPLGPAIRLRAGKSKPARKLVLHVIYLDPECAGAPPEKYPDTFSTIYRLYALAFAGSIKADLAKAATINDRLWLNERVKVESREESYFKSMTRDLKGKVEVTIHKHFPSKPMGSYFELLQFAPGRVKQQIQRGFDDTRKHDCDAADCVLDRETRIQRMEAGR